MVFRSCSEVDLNIRILPISAHKQHLQLWQRVVLGMRPLLLFAQGEAFDGVVNQSASNLSGGRADAFGCRLHAHGLAGKWPSEESTFDPQDSVWDC